MCFELHKQMNLGVLTIFTKAPFEALLVIPLYHSQVEAQLER